MVEIFSKRDTPRSDDVRLRRLIEQNRPTITRIADHISAGAYSAGKTRPQAPQPDGLIIHTNTTLRTDTDVAPVIRISVNGRVSSMDGNSGRQLHHIGDIRCRNGVESFVLATIANGFIAPLDEDIAVKLTDLDERRLDPEYGEDQLIEDIGTLLGIG